MEEKSENNTYAIHFCGTEEALRLPRHENTVRYILLQKLGSEVENLQEKIKKIINQLNAINDDEEINFITKAKKCNSAITRFIRNLSREEKNKLLQASKYEGYIFPSDLYNTAPGSGEGGINNKAMYDGCACFPGFLGSINAWGMRKPTRLATKQLVEKIREFNKNNLSKHKTLKINLSGWSRGSLTAMWVAKRLRKSLKPEELSQVEIHLNLRDPVPGNLKGVVNMGSFGPRIGNMVADLSKCDYIKSVRYDVATKTDRLGFSFLLAKLPESTKVELNVVPGGHKADVYESVKNRRCHYMQAKRNGITGVGKIGLIRSEEDINKYKEDINKYKLDKNNDNREFFQNPFEYNEWKKSSSNVKIKSDYYPKFLFGSRRLYHDPQLSIVNAIAIPPKESDNLFTPTYQRTMLYLDLLKFRLKDDRVLGHAKLTESVKNIQNDLKQIATDTSSNDFAKQEKMLKLLENEQNKNGRQVNRAINYILKDDHNLFAIDRLRSRMTREKLKSKQNDGDKNIIKLNEIDRKLKRLLRRQKYSVLPTGIRAIKNILNNKKKGDKLNEILKICDQRLGKSPKNRLSSTKQFYEDTIKFIKPGQKTPDLKNDSEENLSIEEQTMPEHQTQTAQQNRMDITKKFLRVKNVINRLSNGLKENSISNDLINNLVQISQDKDLDKEQKMKVLLFHLSDNQDSPSSQIKQLIQNLLNNGTISNEKVDNIVEKIIEETNQVSFTKWM